MKGDMVVAENLADVEAMLAARKPSLVKEWKMADFEGATLRKHDETTIMRGMQAFVKARCNQCHVVAGHGIKNLGPDLSDVAKRYKGMKLLQQMLEPSTEINKKYQNYQFITDDGKLVAGVVVKETRGEYHVITNLLNPNSVTRLKKKAVDEKIVSKISPMPQGLLNVLTKDEILDVTAFLEAGGYKLPGHLQKHHQHP